MSNFWPRTGSNCFTRLFEKHPQISTAQYLMVDCGFHGPERWYTSTTAFAKEYYDKSTHKTFKKDFEDLLAFIAAAEDQNKIPLIKEHIYSLINNRVVAQNLPLCKRAGQPEPILVDHEKGCSDTDFVDGSNPPLQNPFILPTSFVTTIAPVILIRHPARNMPSLYKMMSELYEFRPNQEEFQVQLCVKWSRVVYDFWAEFFKGSSGRWPAVVDFDQLVKDEKDTLRRFCERVGIDESEVGYTWERMSEEDFDAQPYPLQFAFGTLQKSTGLVRDEESLKEPDLDEEERRWAETFGEEAATRIRKLVDDSMEDYEFLRKRRV